jgi:hypothetical protein
LLVLVNVVRGVDEVIALLPGAIVLVAIDGLAHPVLLAIDLAAFRRSQVTIMPAAVGANLMVHAGFAGFKVSCFARRQLAGTNALRNAVLLVFATLIDRPVVLGNGKARGHQNSGCKCKERAFHWYFLRWASGFLARPC